MENHFEIQMTEDQLRGISSIGLAHMGDAVFELLVRGWLCAHREGAPSGDDSTGTGGKAGGVCRKDFAAADGGGDRCVPAGQKRAGAFRPAPCQPRTVQHGYGAGGTVWLVVS